MKVDFEELLHGVFSSLHAIEGVKSVDCILEVLKDRIVFPEITILILNARFELVYLFNEQKVVFKTLREASIDSNYIEEINLINQHCSSIESILNDYINTDTLKNYSLSLLSLKYKEKIPNS
ncbi:hypothetical protein [Lysinibacillus fusiformis]|uniref:Uncharacterized protein n=1 Tax=Lysinibacillus fusiformis TaxID=28031 RepID=A0A2I0UZD3_9BACI|nr:hypothetical protein [Lysinibacillus fusiformis]PKU51431.1 hypothetical protein CRI88_12015 [Lysinibacillus fusiformis]